MAGMDTTTLCPDTTHGRHVWDEYTIPGCVHDADGVVTTTPERHVQECLACYATATVVGD